MRETDRDIHTWGPFGVTDKYSDRRRTLYVFGLPIWLPWPIVSGITSSGAVVLGYLVYGGSPAWIQWLAHKIFRPTNQAKWALKHRYQPKHRYNLVRTGLEPGYYDYDTRMLHACFALLCEYVEEEGGIEAIKTDGDTRHVFEEPRKSQITELYDWWKVGKPADEKRRDELMDELFGNRPLETKPVEGTDKVQEIVMRDFEGEEEKKYQIFRALEEKIDADEQAMLHKLIELRPGLWA